MRSRRSKLEWSRIQGWQKKLLFSSFLPFVQLWTLGRRPCSRYHIYVEGERPEHTFHVFPSRTIVHFVLRSMQLLISKYRFTTRSSSTD